eukprot:351506-Hanusia_phi.AAC.1
MKGREGGERTGRGEEVGVLKEIRRVNRKWEQRKEAGGSSFDSGSQTAGEVLADVLARRASATWSARVIG